MLKCIVKYIIIFYWLVIVVMKSRGRLVYWFVMTFICLLIKLKPKDIYSFSWLTAVYKNYFNTLPRDFMLLQYNCNSDGWKNIPSDKQVCEFTPNTLVNCEIRARRESNSNSNKDSEIATDSETTCNSKLLLLYASCQYRLLKTKQSVQSI